MISAPLARIRHTDLVTVSYPPWKYYNAKGSSIEATEKVTGRMIGVRGWFFSGNIFANQDFMGLAFLQKCRLFSLLMVFSQLLSRRLKQHRLQISKRFSFNSAMWLSNWNPTTKRYFRKPLIYQLGQKRQMAGTGCHDIIHLVLLSVVCSNLALDIWSDPSVDVDTPRSLA